MPFQRSRAIVVAGDGRSALVFVNAGTMSHPCLKLRQVFQLLKPLSADVAHAITVEAGWQEAEGQRRAEEIAESVDMLQRSYAMRGVVLLAPGRVLCRLRRSLPAGVSLFAGSGARRDVAALSPRIVEHHLAMR